MRFHSYIKDRLEVSSTKEYQLRFTYDPLLYSEQS